MEAFHLCEDIDLVQIVEDVGWRGVHIERDVSGAKKGKPTAFPVPRGAVIGIGPREALVWTHGDVNHISNKNRSSSMVPAARQDSYDL